MIGSGLKKLAQNHGMKIAHGVGYGNLLGYAVTLSEGSGYKRIDISTKFSDPVKLQELQAQINKTNITKEYRVQALNFAPNGVQIIFMDNPGTMKKLEAFIEWFFPMLGQAGASGVDVCNECGGQMTSGCWKLIDGVAHHMHESCAEKTRQALQTADETRKQETTGSYLTGLIGALLGGAIGAVIWALVLNLGYVASLVGLLIGWLAEKGYTLLKGKQGKGKVAILIVAIIISVLLGNILADVFTLVQMIQTGELEGWAVAEIPLLIILMLINDSEYLTATLVNIAQGLLFAGLGVFALLRKAGQEVADTKFVDLP